MKILSELLTEIEKEIAFQDSHFKGNDKKPLEVWLLLSQQYMNETLQQYAHLTQEAAKVKLLKSVVCGIRGLLADKVTY